MPENLVLPESSGAHRGVATKLYYEASGIMNQPFTLLNEDDLISLRQIVELLKKKQAFLSEQNQNIQSRFDDPDNLDEEIAESEEYDEKICQTIDYVQWFVQRKTEHSSQESSFAAGSTTITIKMQNINLPKLDSPSFSGNYLEWISFFDRFKGAVIENGQLTNSLRLQYLKSAVKGDVNFSHSNRHVVMEIMQNKYDNKRLIV